MPPFRVKPKPDDTVDRQPATIREPNIWERIMDLAEGLVPEGLRDFPLVVGAKALLPPNDVMPMTTLIPTGALASAAAEEVLEKRSGKAEATQALKDAGIKGIQYLDQGSRTTGQVVKLHGKYYFSGSSQPYETMEAAEKAAEAMAPRTRNFVIFDDTIIEIAKKYGVALPVAAEIYRRQQAQIQGHSVSQ